MTKKQKTHSRMNFQQAVNGLGMPAAPGIQPQMEVTAPSPVPENYLTKNWKLIVGVVAAAVALIVVVVIVIKVRSGMRKKTQDDDDDDDDDSPPVRRPPLQPIRSLEGRAPSGHSEHIQSTQDIPVVGGRYPAPGERQASIRSQPRSLPVGGVDASMGTPRPQSALDFQSRPTPYETAPPAPQHSRPQPHPQSQPQHPPQYQHQAGPSGSGNAPMSAMEMAEAAALKQSGDQPSGYPSSPQQSPQPYSQTTTQQAQPNFQAQPSAGGNAGFTPL